ncbi:hypothetical protein BC938DRAFT_474750 [Jimgerdemannia flammicorona]|uniref:Uncharacterized protein n=1 Tax=Jimgerdemannia flammicorona TaxID=994334 RepID=A0A433QS97_9FUNG|nr:hypothetical protein BC938DRAFT_474750 [Jimgerdemannia flammicorona]
MQHNIPKQPWPIPYLYVLHFAPGRSPTVRCIVRGHRRGLAGRHREVCQGRSEEKMSDILTCCIL